MVSGGVHYRIRGNETRKLGKKKKEKTGGRLEDKGKMMYPQEMKQGEMR